MHTVPAPLVSVIIPTAQQGQFIRRALDSLQAQSFASWEALIIDDASDDGTAQAVLPWLSDARVHYHRLERNEGLGRCLNEGMARARGELIAYLPADDLIWRDHLAHLMAALQDHPQAALAYSGARYLYSKESEGQIPGMPLQLVQCMHRKLAARWVERNELESDDLERLYWSRLRARGEFIGTGQVSCEWVDHPQKRHKIMQEPVGGINPFRLFYKVKQPLRFHTSVGNLIDEPAQYRAMRERPDTAPARERLKIVLVGELAYNADRVLALEEQGHKLYGLWMRDPYWYNTVGPLPFGHLEDIPADNWRGALARIKPDILYGLLNWQAVPFAHEVMMATRGTPFAWHFKEGPFICMEKGSWGQLIELFQHADGQLFTSPEMRDWFDTIVPGLSTSKPTLVLDGDLPKRDWFGTQRAPLLSETEGGIHTVVPGRPIGLHPHTVAELAEQGIHLHFYGDFTHGQWREWIEKTQRMANGFLHLHANVDQSRWVQEFSRYDAGWLHFFTSSNGGEVRRANWDDLNYPARMATLAAAGLPMIQRDNSGHIVATQSLVQELGVGLFFHDIPDLGRQLRDRAAMARLRKTVWDKRELFSFDHHAPSLLAFFREVIKTAANKSLRLVGDPHDGGAS